MYQNKVLDVLCTIINGASFIPVKVLKWNFNIIYNAFHHFYNITNNNWIAIYLVVIC